MNITYSDSIIKCNTCFTNLRSGQQQRGFYGIKIKGNIKNKFMFVCNARNTGTIQYSKEWQKSKIRHNFSADFLK